MITHQLRTKIGLTITRHFESTRLQEQSIASAYHSLIPVVARPLQRPRSRCGEDKPSAVTITNPVTTAGTAPTRLISREPASAAMAKRKTGSPVRIPICVPDKCNSSRSAGMTGGTARIGKRSALPTSHNRISDVGSDRDSATWFFPDLDFRGLAEE